MNLARSTALDAVLLDIDLGGTRVWPLADMLKARTVPFAFISAHCTHEDLPRHLDTYACLEKPVSEKAVSETLRDMLRRDDAKSA